MGIINRTLDDSEQKEAFVLPARTVINTLEVPVKIVERPCTLQQLSIVGVGLSGSPTALLRVNRFGGASFVVGSTMLVPAMGTSGPILYPSLPAAGSSLLNLQKNDVVTVLFGGGTGAAADSVNVDIVVENIQDIKTWF